jgi:hypothetical protein
MRLRSFCNVHGIPETSSAREANMPEAGTNWLDTLLIAGIAIAVVGFAFVGALEGWRHWSDNRRIRRHLRN